MFKKIKSIDLISLLLIGSAILSINGFASTSDFVFTYKLELFCLIITSLLVYEYRVNKIPKKIPHITKKRRFFIVLHMALIIGASFIDAVFYDSEKFEKNDLYLGGAIMLSFIYGFISNFILKDLNTILKNKIKNYLTYVKLFINKKRN